MSQHIDAIFENGVFRPEAHVNLADGQRVSLNIEPKSAAVDDLGDLASLLDREYIESCRANARRAPSLEETRSILAAFRGSLADRIAEQRDER